MVMFAAFAALCIASTSAFDVTRYGASPDGASDSTAALQRAIDECAAAGGGTVVVPPGGVYVSRRLSLRSNVELRIDEGATIRCSDEIERFPRYEPTDVWRWDRPVRWNSYAFFYTCGQTNVAITGKGMIDGNSTSERFHVRVDGAYLRTSDTNIVARGLFFAGCRGVRIEGIRYVNPCGWATWFLDCDDVRVKNVTIRCDRERPNGDGLHFGGCRDVSVTGCDIDANDDAIIVRSHQEQMRAPRPCERVRVENCRLRSNQYAVRFGWTGDAPVKDCVFRNIDCPYSNRGLGFALPRIFDPSYTRDPPRGNGIPEPDFPTVPFALENIRFENMRLTSFTIPFGIMVGACERVAYMRNVCFSNCQFRSQLPPVFKFRPQDCVSDWRFVDVDFSIEKPKGSLTPDMGVWFDNAEDVVMERVRWRCVPRDDPEWRITLRAIANGKWERYRDPKTKYINLRPCAKPKPTLPFEVAGAKLRPRVETAPDGAKRFVYGELTDGIFVWKVRVTLEERVVPTGRRWMVNIENCDPGLEVLGFEGPWERFGDFHPLTSSISVCGTQVKDFPESGKGFERISADSVGWVSAGDRDRNRRKEADMRVTEERGRAVYASPWGDSPEAHIASGSHSVSVGAATGGTARRVMLRYDHEYGLLDWCFGYRVTIGHRGSASLGAAALYPVRNP